MYILMYPTYINVLIDGMNKNEKKNMTQHMTIVPWFKADFTHKQNTFPWQPTDGCGWSGANFAVIFVVQATAHCHICQFYLVATSYKTVSVPREQNTHSFLTVPETNIETPCMICEYKVECSYVERRRS
jgi:hypothetical protein